MEGEDPKSPERQNQREDVDEDEPHVHINDETNDWASISIGDEEKLEEAIQGSIDKVNVRNNDIASPTTIEVPKMQFLNIWGDERVIPMGNTLGLG